MKILIVNRNYFVTGGPEKYMFSLMENMPEHEFMPFCVNFDQNNDTPYRRFFLDAPGGSGNVYFNDFQMSLFQKVQFASEMVYSFKARNKLSAMIEAVQPDAALFLNGVYFTDSIIDACRKYGIPIIWRLSDFHKICANYLLFRDGKVCEACLKKGVSQIVMHRCGGYRSSLPAALIKYAGMKLSRVRGLYDHISYYVVPSLFTKEKMIEGGFPPDRIVHIPTFINVPENPEHPKGTTKDILYVGRISPEKGVDILIKAFGRMKHNTSNLVIAGGIKSDYAKGLMAAVPDEMRSRVKFLGFRSSREILALFRKSAMFIVPSICYENQPNVVLEGMAHGTPAIVSKSGSLIELVTHGETGYHFETGNADDLAEKMDLVMESPEKAVHMGKNALKYVTDNHSKKDHLEKLNGIFNRCVDC